MSPVSRVVAEALVLRRWTQENGLKLGGREFMPGFYNTGL